MLFIYLESNILVKEEKTLTNNIINKKKIIFIKSFYYLILKVKNELKKTKIIYES